MKGLSTRIVAGLLIGVSAVCSAATPSIPSLHASSILTDVRTRGAHAVVASLWSDSSRWNQVMANIGRGRPEWLEVAVALHPGTDAGAAETLDEAVFFALRTAPTAVLKLLKEGRFETKFVCSSNVGEDYTTSESQRFIRERIKVLSGLTDAKTLATRDQCLAGLRSALADLDGSK
jgi:hypothetical protein